MALTSLFRWRHFEHSINLWVEATLYGVSVHAHFRSHSYHRLSFLLASSLHPSMVLAKFSIILSNNKRTLVGIGHLSLHPILDHPLYHVHFSFVILLHIHIPGCQIRVPLQKLPCHQQWNACHRTRGNPTLRFSGQGFLICEGRKKGRNPRQICLVVNVIRVLIEEDVVTYGSGDGWFCFLEAVADDMERDIVYMRRSIRVDKVVEIIYDACVVLRSNDLSLDRRPLVRTNCLDMRVGEAPGSYDDYQL